MTTSPSNETIQAEVPSPLADIPAEILNMAAEAVEAMPHRAPFKADVLEAIAKAILAERQRIIASLKEEADLTPCSEDAMVTRSNARLIEANFSYEDDERLAESEEQ